MKITVEDSENIVKPPYFLHHISLNLLVLKVRLCLDVEYPVHKGQNLLDNNLCKSNAQVDIYLKLLLIKVNPVVFLLIRGN